MTTDGKLERWATLALTGDERVWDLEDVAGVPVVVGSGAGGEAWASCRASRRNAAARVECGGEPRRKHRGRVGSGAGTARPQGEDHPAGVEWTDPATGTAAVWALAGEINDGASPSGLCFSTAEGRGFAVQVEKDGMRQFAILRPGGAVETPLPPFPAGEKSSYGRIQGGGWFGHSDAPGSPTLLLNGAGQVYPGFDSASAIKAIESAGERNAVRPLAWHDGALWMRKAWRFDLVKVNPQDGAVLKAVPAADLFTAAGVADAGDFTSLGVTASGMYATVSNQLVQVDWDGKVTSLGPSVLPE